MDTVCDLDFPVYAAGRAFENAECGKVFTEVEALPQTTQILKILAKIQKGDTLMVTKLDRFSRSAAEGAALVQRLHEQGIIIEILNMGRADNTPMGKLMVTMLLAFAEFEHDQIVERLNTGKAVARAHGRKTYGRYKKTPAEFGKYAELWRQGKITVEQACAEMGICRTTWYARMKEAA